MSEYNLYSGDNTSLMLVRIVDTASLYPSSDSHFCASLCNSLYSPSGSITSVASVKSLIALIV
jgi:hypothetical protein